jgi:hypothetical protein
MSRRSAAKSADDIRGGVRTNDLDGGDGAGLAVCASRGVRGGKPRPPAGRSEGACSGRVWRCGGFVRRVSHKTGGRCGWVGCREVPGESGGGVVVDVMQDSANGGSGVPLASCVGRRVRGWIGCRARGVFGAGALRAAWDRVCGPVAGLGHGGRCGRSGARGGRVQLGARRPAAVVAAPMRRPPGPGRPGRRLRIVVRGEVALESSGGRAACGL